MSEENKATVRRFIDEVYNRGNLEYVYEALAPDWTRHGLGGTVTDRAVVKERAREIREAFPDFHIEIEDMLTDGDKVVVRQTHSGTHRGTFAGVEPTGRRVETTEISILRLADGKIREVWVNLDQLTMLRQIGALPEG